MQPVENTFGDVETVIKSYGHASIQDFQAFYGLTVDGVAGPETTSLLASRFCATPDSANFGLDASWPPQCIERDFAYEFRMNLNTAEITQAVSLALVKLNAMSAATMNVITSLPDANIWARTGPLSGSTLAWSYLPNGNCAERLEQRYDTSNRRWSVDMLAKVLLHEWLHAWGLDHSSDRADIMFPSINPNKTLNDYPGPGDVARMVAFYGPAGDEPEPPPVEKYVKHKDYEKFLRDMRDAISANLATGSDSSGTFGL